MDEARALVVVGGDAPLRACAGVLDRALGARPAGALPGLGDERGERAALLGAGGKARARGRPPHAARDVAEDRVAAAGRQAGGVQRGPEALEQQCADGGVVAQQARAAFAVGEAQRGDLVPDASRAVRHRDLEDRGRAVVRLGPRDVGLGAAVVRRPDGDRPAPLEIGHDVRQGVGPAGRARGARLATDDVRDLHPQRLAATTWSPAGERM